MKKTTGCVISVLGILWLLPIVFLNSKAALAFEPTSIFRYGQQSIGIAAGHGLALAIGGSSGGDLRDVQFLYFAPRWSIGLSNPMGGNTWYRGNFELVVEGTFLYGFEPNDGIAGGITPLFRYNFLAGDRLIPFVQFGAGVLALDFDLRRQADGINFTPQAGLGFHYFLSERTALTGEWRYHHIFECGHSPGQQWHQQQCGPFRRYVFPALELAMLHACAMKVRLPETRQGVNPNETACPEPH